MWPVEDIFKTLGLATATTVLLILFDLAQMPKPED